MYIYRGDKNLFFSEGNNMHSIVLSDEELEQVCCFFDKAASCDDFIELKSIEGISFYFEDSDEGGRNLCILQDRMYMIFALAQNTLISVTAQLREYMKSNPFTDNGF